MLFQPIMLCLNGSTCFSSLDPSPPINQGKERATRSYERRNFGELHDPLSGPCRYQTRIPVKMHGSDTLIPSTSPSDNAGNRSARTGRVLGNSSVRNARIPPKGCERTARRDSEEKYEDVTQWRLPYYRLSVAKTRSLNTGLPAEDPWIWMAWRLLKTNFVLHVPILQPGPE
ncbi:uncharacterized protein PV07_03523 [Cladophialophora immunda]|uniref:Uncharacterized protein n=1 Tax=Cladophialophora immunda TaxID=569365 RepID=A0A0D2B2Q4_9EURO|nr:uncharacterized protein PV07_03523 [Cladophialophora immunda]KIW31937.1 hypothetical protein PV07_03523 [Cladophialophora immunda]